MNRTQQFVVLVGAIFTMTMIVFPPWLYVDDNQASHPMGYAPIWQPPVVREQENANIFGFKLQLDVQSRKANTIDLLRLAMQIAIIAGLVTGAAVVTRKASA
jgi:hypothetical protein